jgi:hypothetical protein
VQNYFNEEISLECSEVVADWSNLGTVIIRCALNPGDTGIPGSAIIRFWSKQEYTPYREWIGLEFVNSIPEISGLFPDLYGGDTEKALIVMEDCGGDARLLGDVIDSENSVREEAEEALNEFCKSLNFRLIWPFNKGSYLYSSAPTCPT